MDKIRIMWLSDSVLTVTGFGNQSKEICKRLSMNPDFEVHNISWNYVGQPLEKVKFFRSNEEFNFKIYGGSAQPYAQGILPDYFANIKPHIFSVLLDTFMMYPWILNYSFVPAKSIMYYPSDGEWFPINCENILKKFDFPVAMSKFAQKQVEKLHGIKSDYIPHGTNTNMIYPLPDPIKFQKRLTMGINPDQFVVGVIGRNQGRKNLGAAIRIFAKFAKDKPDTILFLHCDIFDPAAPIDINNLIVRYGLQNKVRMTGMKYFLGAPMEMMNDIYNMIDVKLDPTTGEGFGITIIEAASAEVPSVITDYTTIQELLVEDGEMGIPIPCATDIVGTWNVERGFINEALAVEALNKYYYDRQLIKKHGKTGREKAIKLWDWNRVVYPMWERYMYKVAERN